MKWLAARIRHFASLLAGDYSIYFVCHFSCDRLHTQKNVSEAYAVREIDDYSIKSSSMALLREQIHYLGEDSLSFGCFLGEQLVGVCFYWYGNRYRQRNFWPLGDNEGKLVQVVVVPEMRGQGVATSLLRSSAEEMISRGFRNRYARVWHSTRPSLYAFAMAGWRRIALVIEINPLRAKRPLRLKLERNQNRRNNCSPYL